MTLFIALSAPARAECPNQDVLLATLENQVVRNDLAAADATSALLVEAFGCGALASPEHVARLWLAEAVMLSAAGEEEASRGALAAASRLSSTARPELYGPELVRRWEEASGLLVQPGRILLERLPEGYIGAVDGAAVQFPIELPAGLHLVQVGASVEQMASAKCVDLSPGINTSLAFVLSELPRPKPVAVVPAPEPVAVVPPETAPPVAPRGSHRDRRIVHALVVGGASVLVYGSTFATKSAFYAPDLSQRSKTLAVTNNALVVSSIGMGALSGALLVRGIATP